MQTLVLSALALGFMHAVSWQGRRFHHTEVTVTKSKTIAERSHLA